MPKSATTPLRDYYDALHSLKEYEQTVLAEAHALDPTLLLRRFAQSLSAFNAPTMEPFYDTARANPDGYRSSPDEINSTIKFAAQISDGAPRFVTPTPALAFRYVDRELSPLRTSGENQPARRSLDLLLANAADSLPIYAELKIGADKPSYFALVQLLALAADLLPASQRDRLHHHAGEPQLKSPEAGPYADLYIVTLNAPTTGAFRSRSFSATRMISEKLIADRRFSAQIRRIAYLEAVPEGGTLAFHTLFAYGDGL
jgi:hypothetical protein